MERLITFGSNIAVRRKALGMTQEQLAAKLGISAPAVSKWETGSSYPDITLLCPLARALGINVDTLLQFEETLSDQQVTEAVNRLMEQAPQIGPQAAEQQLRALLRQYSNCTALQFHAAAVYTSFPMLFPRVDRDQLAHWRSETRALLEAVRASGSAAYWQTATIQLAGLRLTDGAPEECAALLRELPERIGDPTLVWTRYYLKQAQPEKAREILQRRLYRDVFGVQTCLVTMLHPEFLPEASQQLRACEAYRAVAQAFGLLDMSDGLEMQVRLQLGQLEEAATCLVRYVDIVTGPAGQLDPTLFSSGLQTARTEGRPATTRELRQMLLRGIEQEEQYQRLLGIPAVTAAIEKLKASLGE